MFWSRRLRVYGRTLVRVLVSQRIRAAEVRVPKVQGGIQVLLWSLLSIILRRRLLRTRELPVLREHDLWLQVL